MRVWAVLLVPTVALRACGIVVDSCRSEFAKMTCDALETMSLPGHPAGVVSPDHFPATDDECVAWLAANASNYDFVVLTGFQYAACATAAAADYPGTNFVHIESCGGIGPNLICAMFREQEPSFVAGYLSGLVTQTKVHALESKSIPRRRSCGCLRIVPTTLETE